MNFRLTPRIPADLKGREIEVFGGYVVKAISVKAKPLDNLGCGSAVSNEKTFVVILFAIALAFHYLCALIVNLQLI